MARRRMPGDGVNPGQVSRRGFIKLAAAGLLAGCSPLQQSAETPALAATPTPAATSTPAPTDTPVPTPTVRPTRAPTDTPTPVPTPTLSVAVRRPEVIRMYPDVPSKVVHAHHAGAWNGETLVPGALRQMLDASITELTGLQDAREAWASLFAPDERIAIKVNTFRNSLIWTHVPLVEAVTDSLQEAGIPAEQIVLFDYYTSELQEAGYTVNKDGPGVRCYGTDADYSAGWTVRGARVELSDVLLGCSALINMPVLKSHMISGITFALKNHYGTCSNPGGLHGQIGRSMAELNALPPIKDRTRLIIGDALAACLRYSGSWPYWRADWTGDSILMSFDPVAHDTVGYQLLSAKMAENGIDTRMAESQAMPCLEGGAELGLGTNDAAQIDLVELT
jgi:hypothetical protein